MYAVSIAGLIWIFAKPLCVQIYEDISLTSELRLFALLILPMYLDIVTDGCLKGLGQMMASMRYNIAEAAIGVCLAILLIPRYGMPAFIAVIFLCELFNFSCSIRRLIHILPDSEKNRLSHNLVKKHKNKRKNSEFFNQHVSDKKLDFLS